MMIEEITNFFVRLGALLGYSGQMPSWLANITSFVLALAMIGLICKHMNVAGLLAWNQKRKDEARAALEAFLVRDKSDTQTRRAVADRLETLYFLSAYSIYAEQPLRDELIRLHGAASGQLQWFHIRRAVQLLKIEDGRLIVLNWWKSIDALTIVWAWVMQVIFAIFMLYSAFVFFKAKSLSFEDGALLGFAIVFSGWIVLYANSTLWPFAEAKRIRTFLHEEQVKRDGAKKSQASGAKVKK